MIKVGSSQALGSAYYNYYFYVRVLRFALATFARELFSQKC